MLSEAERVSLSDILTNIDFAQTSLRAWTMTFAMKERHRSIAWSEIAGAGHIYRHDYEDVAHRLVWGTEYELLPPLRVVVNQELSRSSGSFCVNDTDGDGC